MSRLLCVARRLGWWGGLGWWIIPSLKPHVDWCRQVQMESRRQDCSEDLLEAALGIWHDTSLVVRQDEHSLWVAGWHLCLSSVLCGSPPTETSADLQGQAQRRVAWGGLYRMEMLSWRRSLDDWQLSNWNPSISASIAWWSKTLAQQYCVAPTRGTLWRWLSQWVLRNSAIKERRSNRRRSVSTGPQVSLPLAWVEQVLTSWCDRVSISPQLEIWITTQYPPSPTVV